MAVNNRESKQLANRDSLPQIPVDPGTCGGFVRKLVDVVAFVTGDSATSVYRFFQVSSNAVISSLKLFCDAMGTSCTLSVGVYQTTENGGGSISSALQHLFCTGVDVSAGFGPTEERYTNLAAGTANQQLWQLMGLSADPAIMYDICATVVVATAASGNVALDVSYSQ